MMRADGPIIDASIAEVKFPSVLGSSFFHRP